MALEGKEYKELEEALLGAFPEKEDLKRMLRFGLNKHLSRVVADKNLESIVFELIEAAEAEGWVEELMKSSKGSKPQ